MQYDITAGKVLIETRPGIFESAKFVEYNPERGVVTVERDYERLVEYPADRVYVPADMIEEE